MLQKWKQGEFLKEKYKIIWILQGVGVIAIFAYFFYHSVIAMIFLIPIFCFFIRKKELEQIEKDKFTLTLQFKDAVRAISASLQAGYSMENAFLESYKEMIELYGKESVIAKEWYRIEQGLKNNITLELLLINFSKRYEIAETQDFVEVIVIAKRAGGNITEIIENTARLIEDKVQLKAEIELLVAGKKFEQKIMNVVPFFIIFYLSFTSNGFFDILYGNMIGIIIMTICLGIYLLAYILSEKFVQLVG